MANKKQRRREQRPRRARAQSVSFVPPKTVHEPADAFEDAATIGNGIPDEKDLRSILLKTSSGLFLVTMIAAAGDSAGVRFKSFSVAHPEAVTIQFLTAKSAWGLTALIVLNVIARVVTRDFRAAKLWFFIYCAVAVLFAGLAKESHVGREPETILSLLYCVGAGMFWCAEFFLRKSIPETMTSRLNDFLISGSRLADIAKAPANTRPGRWVLDALDDPGKAFFSPYKVAILMLAFNLFLVHGAMAAGGALGHAIKKHSTPVVQSPNGKNKKSKIGSVGHPITALSKKWNKICPTSPGFDVKPKTGNRFYELYLGGDPTLGPAPGEPHGGCTGATFVPERGNGEFAYEIGRDPKTGALKSVAVVSKQFGAAIYLAPAAKAVLGLIHSGEIVGGPPRLNIANGDIYVIETLHGFYALVRPQKTLPSSGATARYVELGPASVQAWASTMTEADSWLWPLGRRRTGTSETVKFVADVLRPDELYDRIYFGSTGTWAYRRSNGRFYGATSRVVTPETILNRAPAETKSAASSATTRTTTTTAASSDAN